MTFPAVKSLLVGLTALFRPSASHKPAGELMRPAPPRALSPSRLTHSDQWARLTSILSASIERAQGTQKLQTAAAQQLDLAQYGLSTLLDELSAVMTIPNRRGPASVHVLEPSAVRAHNQALAA